MESAGLMWKPSVLLHNHPATYFPFQSAIDFSNKMTFLWIQAVVLFAEPLKASWVEWSFSLYDNNQSQTALSLALPVIGKEADIYFLTPYSSQGHFITWGTDLLESPAMIAGAKLHNALQEVLERGVQCWLEWLTTCELWLPAGCNLTRCEQRLLNDSFKPEPNTK